MSPVILVFMMFTAANALTGCVQWTPFSNQNSVNGLKVLVGSTVADCQQYCLNIAQCIAVDFDSSDNSCWTHTNPADLTPDNIYPQDSVTQYQLSRAGCLPSTTGCVQWTPFSHQNSVNGLKVLVGSTVADCQQYCLNISQCIAVDFDTTDNSCWTHTNPADLTPDNIYTQDSVTQYQLSKSCPSSTTAVSTTTTSPGCIAWSLFLNQNSVNGRRAFSANASAGCQTLCVMNPQCVAIDFDLTDRSCWLHSDVADLSADNTYPAVRVNQYRLSRSCETAASTTTTKLTTTTASTTSLTQTSTPTRTPTSTSSSTSTPTSSTTSSSTTPTSSTSLSTTTLTTTSSTPSSTSTSSTSTSTPTSTTMSTTASSSTLTSTTTPVSTTTTTPSTTSTSTTTSPSTTTSTTTTTTTTTTTPTTPSPCLWTPNFNMNMEGSTANRMQDIPACQLACIYTVSCIGIDIDSNPGSNYCWLSILPSASGTLTSMFSVDHYSLTRTTGCPFYGVTQSLPSSTSTTTTTTTTTRPVTTTTSTPTTTTPSVCFLKKMVDVNSDGGSYLGTMSVSQCYTTCQNQYPSCVAVDYTADGSFCYAHSRLGGTQWNNCCDRYEISCGASCTDSFIVFSNQAPSDIQTRSPSGDTTLADCQNACLRSTNCVAFVFWTVSYNVLRCVLYSSSIDGVMSQPSCNLYIRQSCQQQVSFTLLPVSSPPTPPRDYCLLDIVLVVDTSGSIGMNNSELMKKFLVTVVSPPIEIGLYFDHVGVVTFESSAKVQFDLQQRFTLDSVTAGINGIPSPAGGTNTPGAIEQARQMLLSPSSGYRNSTKKIMLVITDGSVSPEFASNLGPTLSHLNNTNITRIAIGVTDQVKQSELQMISSNPNYVFNVASFSDLSMIRNATVNVMLSLCGRTLLNTVRNTASTSTATTRTTTVSSSPSSSSSSSSTTTTTATTTTTTTSATTTTPSTRPSELIVLGLALNRTYSQSGTTIPLPVEQTNPFGRYTNSSFLTTQDGIHFVEMCIATSSYVQSQVKINGGSPPAGYNWQSTSHNGVAVGCRTSLMVLSVGVRLNLYLVNGAVFSDSQHFVTSLHVFSLSDVMTQFSVTSAVYATVSLPAKNSLVDFIIPFSNPLINPSIPTTFNAATYEYTCTQTGPYFFAITASVPANKPAMILLSGLDIAPTVTQAETGYNGLTTIGRNLLLQCTVDSKVSVFLTLGELNTGPADYNLISFTAFPYQPKNITAMSWAVYRSTGVDASTGTQVVTFDQVNVNQGYLYDNSTHVVNIRRNGYYYVYFTASSQRHQGAYMSLRTRNTQGQTSTLLTILHTSSTASDHVTVANGGIFQMYAGDQLSVAVDSGSVYADGDCQISFFGMLLYYA